MVRTIDSDSGLQEFSLSEFKKQIKEFFKNKTNLVVNYRESLEDESVEIKSWISMYNIIDDTDQYILDLVFRNKRAISVVLPKNKVKTNILCSSGCLYIYEARADEGKEILGVGFTIQS